MMSKKLPKELSPKRVVDYHIEQKLQVESSSKAQY